MFSVVGAWVENMDPPMRYKILSSKFKISYKTNKYRIPRKSCLGSACKKRAHYTFQLKPELSYWMVHWFSESSQLESYIPPKFTKNFMANEVKVLDKLNLVFKGNRS